MTHLRYGLWVALFIALGVRIYWPTLDAGFISDDFIEAAMLDGSFASPREPLDLFVFADGSAADLQFLQRYGSVPWWTDPELRLSFLRPLSSAMIQFDHAVFGRNHVGYHAHSILWWALLVMAVALLLRDLLPPLVALGSVALFALSPGHHFPVLWLANRGGLASLCFGVLALHFHIRHRRDGLRWALPLSLLLTGVALLFGEWVFPVFAYFFAYECLSGPGTYRRRAAALCVAALPALAFVAVRGALGYGARNSGVYIDPIDEPLRFLEYMGVRIPLLWGDMLFHVPAQWWDLGTPWRDRLLYLDLLSPDALRHVPPWRFWQRAIGVSAGLLVALAYGLWTRRAAATLVRPVRWLLLGSLVALIPVVASFPSSRLTVGAWIGAAPLTASVTLAMASQLRLSWPPGGWSVARSFGRFVRFALLLLCVGCVGYVHLLRPALYDLRGPVMHFDSVVQWVRDAELDPQRLADQHIFLLSSAEFTSTFFLPYVLHYEGLPMPRSSHPLCAARHPVVVSRPSSRELLLAPAAGELMDSDAELLFRRADRAFVEGQRIEQGPVTVVIDRLASGGRPGRLRLVFEHPVDDPSYVFLASGRLGLRKVELPEVGERIILPRPTVPSAGGAARSRYERRIGGLPDFLEHDPVPDFVQFGGPSLQGEE